MKKIFLIYLTGILIFLSNSFLYSQEKKDSEQNYVPRQEGAERNDNQTAEVPVIIEDIDGPRATNQFNGNFNANWNRAGNWSLNRVPNSTDDVIIAANCNVNTSSAVCNSLTVNSGRTLTIGANYILSVGSGGISNSGTISLTNATSTTTWLIVQGNFTNNGTYTQTGAYTRFQFNGTSAQTFTNNGTITSPLYSLDLANASGLTIVSTNQIIITRLNLFWGTITNSNKFTFGTGGTSYAVIQRGEVNTTRPAGTLAQIPVFNYGSGVLNLLYDNGSTAYNMGNEVPGTLSVTNVHIFDNADVSMNSDLTITGSLNFREGTGTPKFRIGNNSLAINGTIGYTVPGQFYGGNTSNFTLGGSTTVNSILNGLNNFTINAGNYIGGNISVAGTLYLNNGILVNGNYLTMADGSTISRTALGSLSNTPTFSGTVNLEYTGSNPVTTGKELPISSSVINNLTSNSNGVIQYATTYSTANILTDGFSNLNNWTGNKGTSYNQYATSNSSNAGGTANESVYTYGNSSSTFYTASIYRMVNTSGYSAVNIQWKQFIDNFNASYYPYTIKVQCATSSGGPWTDIYTLSPSGTSNIGPETKSYNNWTTNVGGNFYIRYYIEGYTFGIDYWFFDDLIIDGISETPTASNITINGTLNLQSGTYTIGSGNSLTMGNGTTINRSAGSLSAAPSFGSSVNVIYSGSNEITTGYEIPSAATNILNNLTLSNSAGVTLGSDVRVSGNTNLTTGLLKLSSYTLTTDGNLTVISPNNSKMIVLDDGTNTGTLKRRISTNTTYQYPVGDLVGNADFTPVVLIFTQGASSTSYLSLTMECDKFINNPSQFDYLNRYWDFNTENLENPSYTLELNYLDGDIVGEETNLWFAKYHLGEWLLLTQPDFSLNKYTSTVLNNFSTFTGGEQGALPVKLSSFSSSIIGRDIKLNWITEGEENNFGFDIERADIGEKQINWQKIGFIKGSGTKNTQTSYIYTDSKVNCGKFKYRLKQIDYNGNYEYFNLSNIVEIGLPSKFDLGQNYPNPFNPVTKIDFDIPQSGQVSLKLYDISGKEVYTLVNEIRNAGYYTAILDASGLSSGVYFYRLTANNISIVKRMIVLK